MKKGAVALSTACALFVSVTQASIVYVDVNASEGGGGQDYDVNAFDIDAFVMLLAGG